jgi:hypothetical protein
MESTMVKNILISKHNSMTTLTVFKVLKGSSQYILVHGNSDVKTKLSKELWACTVCHICTSKNSNMYQLSNEERFHRICTDCLFEAGDFIDFCFGIGTSALCKKL